MIDPGAPTTRGTDWLSLDVPQIWGMLADHETETHQRVVSGWRKTAELSQLHLHRLQAYRRELAAAWSPTGSAAAREYIDRLDYLIDTIQQAHDTASANYTTFSGATSAIAQGRRDLQQIYDDYTAKAQIRLDYDRLMQERKAMGGGEIVNSAPPVSDQELQQLRGRARLVMYGLSSELRQAQVELRMPPRYQEGTGRKPGDNAGGFDNGSSLPLSPGDFALAAVAAWPSAISSTTPPPTSASGPGPVLGGAGPLAPTPSLTPGTPPAASPPPALGGGTGFPPGFMPGVGSPPTRQPLHPDLASPATGRPGTGRLSGETSGSRANAPSGIIGGSPTTGPSGTSARGSRVNPVGGVIGSTGASTSPTNRGSALGSRPASQPLLGHPTAAGGPGGSRQNDEEAKRWNPDQPWETEQGVEPVLLPPRPLGRIDPGPAIGYIR